MILGIYKKPLGHLGISSLGKGQQQQDTQFLKQSGTVAEKDEGRLRKVGLSKQLCKAVKETPREHPVTPETDRSDLEGNCPGGGREILFTEHSK